MKKQYVHQIFQLCALLVSTSLMATTSAAGEKITAASSRPAVSQENPLDDLDPRDPNIEQKLREWDKFYEFETGRSAHLRTDFLSPFYSCAREHCTIWAQISLSQQRLYLYINGQVTNTFLVSTGIAGHETPLMDTHPDGRIYDQYTSTKFPQGNYKGLGNMPYAVFVQGGVAIHGTTVGNIPKLGRPASHGCIRLHPDNAFYFNRLVRQYGVIDVWVTIQD
jgi:hypothetical protein